MGGGDTHTRAGGVGGAGGVKREKGFSGRVRLARQGVALYVCSRFLAWFSSTKNQVGLVWH